jgi:hypothetical protein
MVLEIVSAGVEASDYRLYRWRGQNIRLLWQKWSVKAKIYCPLGGAFFTKIHAIEMVLKILSAGG